MTAFQNLPDQLVALAELDALLAGHGISYWLFGGWAVDFHAGRVTREHGDIDIAVWAADHGRLTAPLGTMHPRAAAEEGGDGYTGYERDGVRLEVAFLACDERGCVHTPLRDGRAEWPDGAFGDDRVALQGVAARVIGRGALVAEKSATRADPVTAAKDRADLATLAG